MWLYSFSKMTPVVYTTNNVSSISTLTLSSLISQLGSNQSLVTSQQDERQSTFVFRESFKHTNTVL